MVIPSLGQDAYKIAESACYIGNHHSNGASMLADPSRDFQNLVGTPHNTELADRQEETVRIKFECRVPSQASIIARPNANRVRVRRDLPPLPATADRGELLAC